MKLRVKIGIATECWEWLGAKNTRGYGHLKLKGRVEIAPRVTFTLFFGHIPKHRVIRHTCDNPTCVNPRHLLVGTQKDNALDRKERRRHPYYKQTHCKQGHEFTAENTRQTPTQRLCRACTKIAWTKSNHKKRLAKLAQVSLDKIRASDDSVL